MAVNVPDLHTPIQAAQRIAARTMRDGFQFEALHEYTDCDGHPLHWRIRLKHSGTGEKWIRPMKRFGDGFKQGEPKYPDGKPLYRLHDLAARPSEVVVVTEGEHKADELASLGLLVTTSGAADSAGMADWQPLAGRDVLIWPDNDAAGRRYADAVAAVLERLGCTVRMLDVAALGLEPKGDAANWLAAHPSATAADVLALACLQGPTIKLQADDAVAPTPHQSDDSAAADAIGGAANRTIERTNYEGAPRSQASILTDIGKAHYLLHDDGGDAYARVRVDNHAEVFAIGSAAYQDCLSRDYYRLTGKGAGRNPVAAAVSTLTAMAKHDGPCEPVYLRTGAADGCIVLDTGGSEWKCIEVRPSGWRVSPDRIVNFRRSGKATALPTPTAPGFARLWRYVNVEESDKPLIAGWLLAALRPTGPYPILLLIGEQGTGKSVSSRTLKRLTDPSAVLLRSPPRDEKDLLVSALSSWVLALDNMSGAKPELSDALCRISTGGGLAGRTLYTNADETLLEVKRPVILNGIDDLASRPDLAERCLHIELPPLPTRTTEAELDEAFAIDGSAIFAALLDGLALALRDHHIRRERLPRMADFAKWAAAGVPALGYSADGFLDAYRANQAGAIEAGLETSALASTLRKVITRLGGWSGSSTQLLALLNREADPEQHAPGWPRSPKGLITVLRRLAPSLRHIGIEYVKDRNASSRLLTFTCIKPGQASQASLTKHADDGVTLVTHDELACRSDDSAVIEGEL